MTLQRRELAGSKHPGQMTAVMRAGERASSVRQQRKVLRIGVVQDGRMREERSIRSPAHVSVGTSEANSFLLGGGAAPTSFRLFERIGETYHLNFTSEMRGRVALASGLFELDELRAWAPRAGDGAHRIALSEEARGKVVLGEVSFLFHFVEPSPLPMKAVLPGAVLRDPLGIDWNNTICAAVSFLLHFMILGAVYSDWADPVIDDDVRTAGLVDSLKNLPPPPQVEEKPIPDDSSAPVRDNLQAPQAKPSQAAPTKSAPLPDRASPPSGAEIAALSKQLAQIDASILGTLTNAPVATSTVFQRGEVAWRALDSAAASAAGVGAGSETRLASRGAPVRFGTFGDFRQHGTSTRGPEGHGSVLRVNGPTAVANLAPPATSGGLVSNAARVVAGMRAGFRACYQRGLAADPDASGSIRLTIRIGPGGEVSGVSATPSGNLPATMVSCVQARAQAAQFAAPEGGSAVITVPVTFVKQ